MSMNRRRFIIAAGAGVGVSALGFPATVRAQTEPIRIGLLTVKTGPLASGGLDMERALVMYLRERNDTLAGRKVELFVADTAGSPATARTKTQELVEEKPGQGPIGPLDAGSTLANDDYIREEQIPTVFGAAGGDIARTKTQQWVVA